MNPEEFWADVELIQQDLRMVQFQIVSLWEILYEEPCPILQQLIRDKIKEKSHKEWRFICQLEYLQDNMSNPNL